MSAIVFPLTWPRLGLTGSRPGHADVAQLVAHHLAKVRVAGSSPVVRSKGPRDLSVEWPRGEARDCKSLYTGSNPVSTSQHHQDGTTSTAREAQH